MGGRVNFFFCFSLVIFFKFFFGGGGDFFFKRKKRGGGGETKTGEISRSRESIVKQKRLVLKLRKLVVRKRKIQRSGSPEAKIHGKMPGSGSLVVQTHVTVCRSGSVGRLGGAVSRQCRSRV